MNLYFSYIVFKYYRKRIYIFSKKNIKNNYFIKKNENLKLFKLYYYFNITKNLFLNLIKKFKTKNIYLLNNKIKYYHITLSRLNKKKFK